MTILLVLAWQLTNTSDLCLSLGHETLSLLKQLLQQQNTYFKYKAEQSESQYAFTSSSECRYNRSIFLLS